MTEPDIASVFAVGMRIGDGFLVGIGNDGISLAPNILHDAARHILSRRYQGIAEFRHFDIDGTNHRMLEMVITKVCDYLNPFSLTFFRQFKIIWHGLGEDKHRAFAFIDSP